MESDEYMVVPGSQTTVEIVKSAGDMMVVRLLKVSKEPLTVVQVGAITAIDGNEVPVARLYQAAFKEGSLAKLTWISGTTSEHLAQVSFTVRGSLSPDVQALKEGLAIPSATIACDVVRSQYRSAVQEAARTHRGAWGDAQESADLRVAMQESLGLKDASLRPTFFYANPGFGILFFVLIIVVVAFAMKSEHEVIVDETRGDGMFRRVFRYTKRANARMFGSILFPRREPFNQPKSTPPVDRKGLDEGGSQDVK